MDYFLHASEGNTRIKIKSLGEVELKYISGGDSDDFAELITKKLSDKELVERILYHQLIKPKLSFEDFQKLPDNDLQTLATAFMKNEDFTFRHTELTGDVYKDFAIAIDRFHEQQMKELREMTKPMIASAQKALAGFDLKYQSIVGESLKGFSSLGRALNEVNKIDLTGLGKMSLALKPIMEQQSALAINVAKLLTPQIDIWKEWADQNQKLFDSTRDVLVKVQKDFNIAEKEAAKVLRKYKWFISPSIPLSLVYEVKELDNKSGRQDKAVNELFINYFERNDWQALENMANRWSHNSFFKSRYKIIVDCVLAVKTGSKNGINASNVVLPTLIIQIDGILNDYMHAKGLNPRGYNDRNTILKSNPLPVPLTSELEDVATEIFLNILFQRSQAGTPLATPYNFNRHKILHAENTAYGRKDYTIRAFMVLDLLASLK